jgi:hypothetical protein
MEKFDMDGVVLTLIGALIGYYLYREAKEDAREGVDKLRQLDELTLYAHFNRDAKLEPRYDEDGNGIIVGAVGHA